MTATPRRQFLGLIVLLLATAAAQFPGGQYMASTLEADLARDITAQQANQGFPRSLTDAETGVRGYELTGDPTFLEPYDAGMSGFPAAYRRATAGAGNASVRVLLRAEDTAARRRLAGWPASRSR